MKPVHIPRSFIILVFVLIIVTFLTGNVRTFALARASTPAATIATIANQTESSMDLTPTPLPTPILASADTTGIIALASVIVIVVLIGAVWGGRGSRHR